MDTFGKRVKQARELRGWSQAELGRRVSQLLGRQVTITKAAVQKWEAGATRYPEADVVAALALVFMMPHDLLIWGQDRKPPGMQRSRVTPAKNTGNSG